MKFFRGMIGFCIAGMIVMSVWTPLAENYGIFGGYLAAFIIIGPMWFMNHYVGLIENDEDKRLLIWLSELGFAELCVMSLCKVVAS